MCWISTQRKKQIQLFMMLARISLPTQQVYEILLVEWLHKNLQMCLAESFSNNSPVVTAWLSVTHLTGSRPGWRTALQSSWDFLPGHAPIWWLEMAELLYESWNFIKKITTHPMYKWHMFNLLCPIKMCNHIIYVSSNCSNIWFSIFYTFKSFRMFDSLWCFHPFTRLYTGLSL